MNTPMETASNAVHTFDPDRVAALETRSWRQYYDRDWLGMFRTLVALHREQFSLSHLGALLATLSASRAARTFAPLESSDPDRARQQLVPYYRRARVALGSAASAESSGLAATSFTPSAETSNAFGFFIHDGSVRVTLDFSTGLITVPWRSFT